MNLLGWLSSFINRILIRVFQDACRDFHEVLHSIDDGNLEDQLVVVEYVEDIYKFYGNIEVCFPVNECSFL